MKCLVLNQGLIYISNAIAVYFRYEVYKRANKKNVLRKGYSEAFITNKHCEIQLILLLCFRVKSFNLTTVFVIINPFTLIYR